MTPTPRSLQRKAAIVLGLLFCLILDFENSENERKDDVGDKKQLR